MLKYLVIYMHYMLCCNIGMISWHDEMGSTCNEHGRERKHANFVEKTYRK